MLNVKIEGAPVSDDGEESEEEPEKDEKTKGGGLGGIGTKKAQEKVEIETIDDRVFVCLGKTNDGTDKRQVWVMTINRTFDQV